MAIGDVHRYGNGNTYIETEAGPIVRSQCYLCGASAACHLDLKVSDVRCGECLARAHELLPGQQGYEAIRRWQASQPKRKKHVAT